MFLFERQNWCRQPIHINRRTLIKDNQLKTIGEMNYMFPFRTKSEGNKKHRFIDKLNTNVEYWSDELYVPVPNEAGR